METKILLDTPGVHATIAAIYAKTATEQEIIRQEIRTDLRAWVNTHLALNPAQSAYLSAMSEPTLQHAGNLIANALEERVDFLYMESTPIRAAARDREPQGKEILMGMKSVERIVPEEDEEDLFLILVNYYGEDSL